MSDAGAASRPRPRGRITRSGDFDAVYRRGRSAGDRLLVVYSFRRPEAGAGDAPRLGLSVSKKVGGAVARNRVKRVLRERFAEVAPGLPAGSDWVVIARPGLHEHIERHGSAVVADRLRALTGRLGGGEAPPGDRSPAVSVSSPVESAPTGATSASASTEPASMAPAPAPGSVEAAPAGPPPASGEAAPAPAAETPRSGGAS